MYSNELICDVLNYIDDNINKEITILELSSIFSYDKTYLMKRFKKEIGITIKDYINSKRIFNSLNFYSENNYILGIVFSNGFNSIEYYSETFKKIMGVSPRRYRNFVNRKGNVNDDDILHIREAISSLTLLNDFVFNYKRKRKPKKAPVRVLSIFR